jgi:hypothetical protein
MKLNRSLPEFMQYCLPFSKALEKHASAYSMPNSIGTFLFFSNVSGAQNRKITKYSYTYVFSEQPRTRIHAPVFYLDKLVI